MHSSLTPSLLLFTRLFAAVIAIALSGCGGSTAVRNVESVGITTLTVHHYRNGCIGEGAFLCLQVSSDGGAIENFYSAIEGFDFEWGYRYDLDVRVEEIANPPADGSSLRYRLIDEVARTRIAFPEEVSVWVPATDVHFEPLSATQFRISDGQTFICAPSDCATLNSLIAQRFWVALDFQFPVTEGEPLVLARIRCSDAEQSFFESCL